MDTKRSGSTVRGIARIILVAALYYALTRLSFSISQPQDYIPIFWLSTGFALALAMLWGPSVAIAVFFGSFFFRLGYMKGPTAPYVSAAIAAGFSLQILAGVLLFRRHIKKLFPANLRETLVAFALLFLTSLLAPLIGVTSLCVAGLEPWTVFFRIGLEWCIASLGSIFIFTPSLMGFISYLENRALRESFLWPLSAAILGITCVSALMVVERDQRENAMSFRRDVNEIAIVAQNTVTRDLNALSSLEAFFVSSQDVTRAEFRTFTYSLLAEDATALMYSWVPRVTQAERPKFERTVRAEGYPAFFVYARDAAGKSVPAPVEPKFLYPVDYIEPFAQNAAAFGFDIGSTEDRLRTIIKARDSGTPAVTPPIRLVQEPEKTSFLVMVPLYRQGVSLRSPDERRENFLGLINASFRADVWIRKALAQLNRHDVELFVFDAAPDGQSQFIAFSPSISGKQTFAPPSGMTADAVRSDDAEVFFLNVGDRTWVIVARAGPDYGTAENRWLPWAIFLVGLALAAIFLIFLARSQKMQESLRASEKKYRFISENTSDVIWSMDLETRRFIFVSPSIEKMLGYTQAEAMALRLEDLIPPATFESLSREMAKVTAASARAAARAPRTFELDQIRKDGSIVPVEASVSVAEGEAGKLLLVGITRDITERRTAEKAIRTIERRSAALVENAPDGTAVIDADGVIKFMSPAALQIFGKPPEEMLGHGIADLVHPEDRQKRMDTLKKAADNPGTPFLCEFRFKFVDGSYHWLSSAFKNLMADESVRGIVVNFRDITAEKKADEALRKSQARLELAQRAARMGSWEIGVDSGKESYWSEEMFQLFDRDPAAGVPELEEFLDCVHPDDRNLLAAKLQEAADAPGQIVVTFRRAAPQGELRYFQGTLKPAKDAGGRTVAITGTAQDITDLKRVEHLLRESNERFTELANNIEEVFWLYDFEEDRMIYVSPAYERIWGRKPESIYDNRDDSLNGVLPEDLPILLSLREEDRTPKHSESKYRIRHSDGTIHWIWDRSFPIFNERGKVVRRAGIETDITDLKNAQQEMEKLNRELEKRVEERTAEVREREATYRGLFENSNDGIFLVSPEGEELRANQKALDMIGYTQEEYWALSESKKESITSPESREAALARFEAALRGEYVPPFERALVRKDGSRIDTETTLSAIKNAAGGIMLVQSVVRDITERKKAEERLRESRDKLSAANAALEKASRMKDEFLASMSHELRTPLTGILGLSEAMQLRTFGELNEKQLKALANIESSGRHLLDLINDILDLSKIEAGRFELQIEPCQVSDLCQASLQLVKGLAQQKRQSVGFSMNRTPLEIRADVRRLKQMLVNLLSNAIKFTPESGSLGLEVTADEGAKSVRFTVWDKGIGIKDEDLEKLFKPFVQLDSSLSRQYSGTGLGLSLVRRMAELHGGGVQVESAYGEGSRFTIVMPWDGADASEAASPAGTGSPSLSNALIVEDNPLDADLLTAELRELRLDAVVHPVLEGALEKAVALRPGAILLDLNLPDGSGLDLLARLKADDRTKNIPVIIVSVEDLRRKAMQLGAQGYIVKPCAREELRETLEKVAGRAGEDGKILVVEEKGDVPLVLIADDSELILETVTDFLEARGYKTIAARSGLELLDIAPEIRPDLMLVDIQMPGMDGMEAIRRIRAMDDRALAVAPIVAITALAMEGDREKCMQAGASEYLSKPFTLTKLEATIRGLLKRG